MQFFNNKQYIHMNKEEVKKLRADDCVLVPAFVRLPSYGSPADDGSVVGKFGEVELSAPSSVGNTALRVLPEQIVGRCPARKDLKVGDIVLCDSSEARGIGFVVEMDDVGVIVKLMNNCLLHMLRERDVTLLISVEELQDREERALVIAAKKRAYAKGGIVALEEMTDEVSAKEGGEA